MAQTFFLKSGLLAGHENVLEPCEDVIIQPVTVLAAPALYLMLILKVLLREVIG